jgi:hypothetical protein
VWFTFVFNLCFIVSGSYTINHIVIHQNDVVKTYSFI